MQKIPVGATIVHAYRFAFGGFVNLVRVSWLPQLGILALVFLLLLPVFGGLVDALSAGAHRGAGAAILKLVPAYLGMLLLVFVQITAVTQSALGLRPGGSWLVFPFGRPLWRLVGAFLLLLLIFIALFIVVGVVAVIAMRTGATGLWLGPVIRLLADLLEIFLALRLGFFLAPVAVGEGIIGIGRSWRLSRGNFWRLFVIALAILLPFIALQVAALFWLMPHLPTVAPGMDAAQYRVAVLAWEAGSFQGMESHWIVAVPVIGLLTVLIYGLLVGAQCFAYRAVTQTREII